MRVGLRTVVVLLLAGSLASCKSNGESEADAAALANQKELLARRDALVAARQKLQADKSKLDQQIAQSRSAGSNTTDLEKQRDDIENQLSGKTEELVSTLNSKLGEIKAAGNQAVDTVAREQRAAEREKVAADREKAAADRERAAADREKVAADREAAANAHALECAASAAPVVMQMPAPKGTNYTKADIQPLLQRARTAMAKKGLLPSDLGPAGGLEAESTKAMGDGDWGKAFLAASQLAQTVDAIKVDHDFIRAKVVRFNAAWAAHKQDAATQKQIADGTSEVTKTYGDANYVAANARLNQLFGELK